MANIKLLQEAIHAFANGNNEIADKKMRKYFVEQAQEINKKLEEEMEAEEEDGIDADPEKSMTDETGYKLNEDDDLDEGLLSPDINANGNSINIGGDTQMDEGDEHPEDSEFEFDDKSTEGFASPDSDQWESIKSAFEDLERMFDEIEGGDGVEFDDEQSDEFDDEQSDEFGDVQFGDEKVGESYQMKKVAEPEKTENAGVNKKSVVAPNAKSTVDGVKPVTIKNGTVDATDDKFENSDAMDVKVEDHNNVMDNGKHVMKPAKTPKNTAEKSRSPLPKSK